MFGSNENESMPVPRGGQQVQVVAESAMPVQQNALANANEAGGLIAYERAQIDCQIATAKAYPRNIQQFLTNCIAAATADREIAESLFYMVPVGKENGRQKYVEGPSIRLAELVAAYYKNIRMETGIIEQTDKSVTAFSIAADFEANTARRFLHSESIVDKYGNRYSDRQIERIKDVAQSKALRKALFTVVPVALIKPIVAAAKQVINGGKTLNQRREDMVKWISSLKIDAKRVWNALGVEGPADINDSHITQMVGIYNAIRNGETTADEAFPPVSRFQQAAAPADDKDGNANRKTGARARARKDEGVPAAGDFISQAQAEEVPVPPVAQAPAAASVDEANALADEAAAEQAKEVLL